MVEYIELSDDEGPPMSLLPRAGPSVIRERDQNVDEVEVIAHGSMASGGDSKGWNGRGKGKGKSSKADDEIILLSPASDSSDRLPDIDDIFGAPDRTAALKASRKTHMSLHQPPATNPAPLISSGIEAFSSSPAVRRSPSPAAHSRGRVAASKIVKRASNMAPRPTVASAVPRVIPTGSQEDASDLVKQAKQLKQVSGPVKRKAAAPVIDAMDLEELPASFWDVPSDLEDLGGPSKKRVAERSVTAEATAPQAKKVKKATIATSTAAAHAKSVSTSASTAGLTAAEKKALKEQEKAAAKVQKELDKAEKARFTEANKLRTSRVDTLRQITMHISPDLDKPTSLLFHSLPILRAKFETNASQLAVLPEDDSSSPGVIRFKRFVTSRYDAASKVFIPLPRGEEYWQDESTLLLLVEAKEVVEHITRGRAGSAYGLCEWFGEVRDSLKWRGRGRSQVVLIIHGLKAYHAKTRSLQAKAFRKNAEQVMAGEDVAADEIAAAPAGRLTPEDIDKELARLHVLEKCFQVHVDKKDDLEEWIWNLACDVAIRPYKLIKKSHLPFSTEEVTRKGRNPKDTFQLMLEQIPLITPSSASGIVEQYPSFRSLMEGMERMERREAKGKCTKTEVETFLKDCQIRNLVTGHETNRALGVARSTKVYNVFRGEDSLAML